MSDIKLVTPHPALDEQREAHHVAITEQVAGLMALLGVNVHDGEIHSFDGAYSLLISVRAIRVPGNVTAEARRDKIRALHLVENTVREYRRQNGAVQ